MRSVVGALTCAVAVTAVSHSETQGHFSPVVADHDMVSSRAWDALEGVATGRTAAVQQTSDPSKAECVMHKGSRLCLQRVHFPTCPEQFRQAAYSYCAGVMAFLEGYGNTTNTTSSGKLWWWTDDKCLVHRTLCEVIHSTHGHQYEEDIYDFSDSCSETAHNQFQYSYRVQEGNTSVSQYLHGTAILKHGDEHLLLSIKRAGVLLREEYLAILLYERNQRGQVTYSTSGFDDSLLRKSAGDMTGMYAQLAKRITLYDRYTGRKRERALKYNYRVTNYAVLPQCPPDEKDGWQGLQPVVIYQSVESDDTDAGLIIGVIIGVVVFIALCSFAVHYFLMKRKAYFADMSEANTKPPEGQVRIVEVQQADAPVQAVVIQGVPVPSTAMGPGAGVTEMGFVDDACSAAPLPPPLTEQC